MVAEDECVHVGKEGGGELKNEMDLFAEDLQAFVPRRKKSGKNLPLFKFASRRDAENKKVLIFWSITILDPVGTAPPLHITTLRASRYRMEGSILRLPPPRGEQVHEIKESKGLFFGTEEKIVGDSKLCKSSCLSGAGHK